MTPADVQLVAMRWPALGRDLFAALAEPCSLVVRESDAAAEARPAPLHTVTHALAAVIATASASEADGFITPDEASAELDVWDRVQSVASARGQMLMRARRSGGLRVAK